MRTSPQDDVDREARKPSVLVPIRVELETETSRIRDCFVWNLNEELITPNQFARAFCTDLDLPMHPYSEQVAGAIRAQLEEHSGVATIDLKSTLKKKNGEVDFYAEAPGDPVPDCRVILSVSVALNFLSCFMTLILDKLA
jgi:chromatin structure-remodeling complex subunit SFH1